MLRSLRIYSLMMLVLAMACGSTAWAQKKIIAQAKTIVKSGKDLYKAEQMMNDLLAEPSNIHNEKIWLTLFDAVRSQYNQDNEKLYLKQKVDTAALFRSLGKMFNILERFDTIDATPDKKGVVRLKYRQKHAMFLDAYRPNLFNGGTFHAAKGNYDEAYQFFSDYLMCDQKSLFQGYDYEHTDSLMPQAAYWATYCGYKMKDLDKTVRYADMAKADTAKWCLVMHYLAERFETAGDTTRYFNTIREGFEKHPEYPYFFPRLIDYYNATGRPEAAREVVDMALQRDSDNTLYLFAKSNLLLNEGKYNECIDICNRLIERDDSLANAYQNIGLAFFNQAVEMEKSSAKLTKAKRKKIREFYAKSLPYMEKYRALAPNEKEKWVPVLYMLYLNLNKGKEFEEIDAIRATMKERY